MTDQDLVPHPQARPPIDGELREFGTNAGALWQYTRIDGCLVRYGYGVTPEEAKSNLGKIVWATKT